MQSCVRGSLPAALPHFHQDMVAVAVVAVSGGYPGAYKKGLPILGDCLESHQKWWFVVACSQGLAVLYD